ncbi:glycoside hydrolase family 3 protein [Thermothielavioides terrestris NRRL 8126]|uniref:beta-glucosidase n=1 Tax=Thermothielavioides terrestris (strain ATCC 38088 / NRRL 8126) TaxID=578455 RepID=G2R7W7_THETT|nr:glycoside hydrolase family 3 protein [Thermothielavioides terrestris NRRL 8126]AEO68026.1 glycoside hydrolase family 3 protein [Thermothielavioides terrestris NRRL 8126]
MATTIPFLLALLSLSSILFGTTKATDPDVLFPGYPSPWAAASGASNTTILDPSWAAAYARAVAFVANLTLPEKVNLTTGTGWQSDRCIGNTGGVPRLGLRGLCLMDGPLGVRRRLMRLRGEALGAEFRGKGIDIMLGPVAGPLGRAPEGGRNWEAFGPDPYLAGVAMAETIQGIQSRGVVACAKHFILNEQEHYRGSVDVRIDDRTMHELYLWPFADAVRAGVGSVMCSYNKINGTHACENAWTTNYLLKNELAFQGFVMSDWGAQHTTLGSALAGLDMTMSGDGGPPPYRSWWGGALTEAVLKGDVPQWRLDDMVVRIMAAYFKVHTGEYEAQPDINFSAWTNKTVGPLHPSSNQSITTVNEFVDVQDDHAALIREIGAKSIVLLKNTDNFLPLRDPPSIAVIGNDAQDPPGGPNACPERGCFSGTVAMGYGSGTANFPYLISPATAILEHTRHSNTTTTFTNTTSNWDPAAAAEAARNASVAIVFAAATAGEAILSIDGNAGDRNNLSAWDNAAALIAAVAGANAHTVVVLHTPGPVLLDAVAAHENVSAILWAGFPGQESGRALVDVLFGCVSPQGRSPFTWGASEADYGAQVMYSAPDPKNPVQVFGEGVLVDYRWFQRHARGMVFPFGFGLTYTRFRYSDLKIVRKGGVQGPYPVAKEGVTGPAPMYGGVVEVGDAALEGYMPPDGFKRISPYVYPWLNSSQGFVAGGQGNISEFPAAARNGSAQPLLPASGAPGGNPGLYEVLYTVTASITNEGDVAGTEIPQLYVQLGGEDNPWGVLRGFDEVELQPGETKTVTFELTRRDISNWNTTTQNWQITDREKVLFVGSSVRDIHLNASLPAPEGMAWHVG